jgi:amino acid transporter
MELKRHLTTYSLLIMGIAGAVGTGVLFSTAGMTAISGPAVIVAWLIGGIFYSFIGLTFVELSLLYPEAGGPSRYSLYTHGKFPNLINALSDLIWYLFIPPVEALASAEGLNFIYPHLVNAQGNPTTLGAIVAVILMILFFPFNYFGIKAFSRSTNVLGIAKLIIYVLVAIGFITFARFANFANFGGFVPFGLTGIFAAIPLAMFAFGGIRVIPDFAEEAHNPRSLRSSIIWTIIGQTIVYLLFSIAFIVSLNWSQLALHPGAWSNISKLPGNPFLVIAQHSSAALLIGLTTVIAIIGPFVTGYIYQGAGARVLFAMGRTGFVTARMKELNERYSIPAAALIVFTIVGIIVAYIAAPLPSIYSLITDAVVAGYIGFAINPVAMLALRREGRSGPIQGGTVIAVLAFAAASLITYWSGWPSVPYAVILLAIGVIAISLIYRVREGLGNALWYICYILFLVLMTYIGDVGAKKLVNFDIGSLIVVVVSVAVFLPWGVASRLTRGTIETKVAA